MERIWKDRILLVSQIKTLEVNQLTFVTRGGTALLTFIWAYFRLPETKGRTYEELDILFAKKVSARNFASEKVDAYETHIESEVVEKK